MDFLQQQVRAPGGAGCTGAPPRPGSGLVNRLLLFDIDGTMLTCSGRGVRAMHTALQQVYGLAAVEAQIQPQGKTDPMLFEEVGAAYGLAPDAIVARHPVLHDTYVEVLRRELLELGACETKPGVPALLAALAARADVVLGIVSGNLERAAWLKLEAAGLRPFFTRGAFGSDGRRRADLVGLALQRFTTTDGGRFGAEEVWVIGDTPDDVAGGRAHGTRTLAVATGSFTRTQLMACNPETLLDDFADTASVIDILCDRC